MKDLITILLVLFSICIVLDLCVHFKFIVEECKNLMSDLMNDDNEDEEE